MFGLKGTFVKNSGEATLENSYKEILEHLFRLQALLRHRHMIHHKQMGPLGAPHHGQGRILALLKLQPEISQKQLSSILDIRSQSLGELLGKLENLGYITRALSEADRRSLDIRLTDEGRKASEKLEDAPESETFLACLSAEEQVTFSAYLERLIGRLEVELGSEVRTDDFRSERGRGGHGRRFQGEDSGPEKRRHGNGRFHRGA